MILGCVGSTLYQPFFTFVLLVQPLLQRRKIFQDGPGIHSPLAGQDFQRIGPGFALAHGQHLVQLCSRCFRAVEGAAVERAFVSRLAAEGVVELELQNVRQEISRVGDIGRYVILRSRIEIGFAARHWRRYSLILQAHLPPCFVVIGGLDLAGEYFPAPLIDH